MKPSLISDEQAENMTTQEIVDLTVKRTTDSSPNETAFYRLKGESEYVTDGDEFWTDYCDYVDHVGDVDEWELWATKKIYFQIGPCDLKNFFDRWILDKEDLTHIREQLLDWLENEPLTEFAGENGADFEIKGVESLARSIFWLCSTEDWHKYDGIKTALDSFHKANRHMHLWAQDKSNSATIKIEPVDLEAVGGLESELEYWEQHKAL